MRSSKGLKSLLKQVRTPLKVAVIECVVNGPGEAREADVDIAGGKGIGILFKKGERVGRGFRAGVAPAVVIRGRADDWRKIKR